MRGLLWVAGERRCDDQVIAQMSLSVDGCYAGPVFGGDSRDVPGWMGSPEALGFFRVTRWVTDAMAWRERQGYGGGERSVNSDIVEESFAAAGAYVMGRRMFEGGNVPWGEEPPFRAPVFVVTHRAHDVVDRAGGTSFTFVTDGVEQAIAMARAAAGGKDVADRRRGYIAASHPAGRVARRARAAHRPGPAG